MALPAVWTGRESPQILSDVLDALFGMLRLTLLFGRLNDTDGGTPTELVRVVPALAHVVSSHEIGHRLDGALQQTGLHGRVRIGTDDLSIACARLGLHGEIGILVAGSDRSDFPLQNEKLLMDIAANQAAIGLQQTRRLSDERRLARELDARVSRRTGELAAAKARLEREVGERRHAEQLARASAREARLIVDSVPGMVALLGPDGGVEFVNRRILEYSGRSREELRQWGTSTVVHPDDLPRVRDVFTRSIADGRPYDIVQRLRRADGAYRWFLNSGHPVRDSDGQVVRWCVLLTDIDDRKRAEDAIRDSERNLKLTIDTIPALAWSARADGSTEFLSQHYLDFIGMSAEAASDWGWIAALHPDDSGRLQTTWRQIIASGAPGEAEVRLRRADGQYRWFLMRINPLRGDDGRVVKWYGINLDIEDRKRTEEELRRSEAFLSQAQTLTLTGSLWWETATGQITWSQESYRLMDYPTTIVPTVELILERVHPDDLALVRETVDRLMMDGTNADFEHRLLIADGSVKHVHLVLQNVAAPPSPPVFVGAVTDVTARKHAEAELRRAHAHLSEAQRLSQTGSFTVDLERDECYWSHELYRICGFEPGSAITVQRLRRIVHGDDLALFDDAVASARAGADSECALRIVTPEGIKHLRGFAHRSADRAVVVGAVHDVTATRRTEEALSTARSELAHVSRVTTFSALTASIAHEVNQPLSGIITNAGTCLRMLDANPPDIDGARETARRAIRDGNRAADVVARLRALFTNKDVVFESLDLNEAAREVIALSLTELQRQSIVLRTEFAADLPPVTGDRIQLQQVILNLLRNASDAMTDVHDRPRDLLIRTECDGVEGVRLTVRDAGSGIDPAAIHKLFDPFYTTKSDGMGIGLSVSRSIVERHDGRLWASANEGFGATFAFSISTVPPG